MVVIDPGINDADLDARAVIAARQGVAPADVLDTPGLTDVRNGRSAVRFDKLNARSFGNGIDLRGIEDYCECRDRCVSILDFEALVGVPVKLDICGRNS